MSLKQPVQYPVKYYSHADADAPQLADADGVIKTILKACLVTGYGTKESAGWESLFEDPNSIVLRLPAAARAMGAPDIKIDNGAGKYRIVSQDDPTGLDDTAQLASANLLMRDSAHGSEWHLVVTDLGFLLCYQMGETGQPGYARNNMIYVGALTRLVDAIAPIFIVNVNTLIAANGTGGNWQRGFLDNAVSIKDLTKNTNINGKYLLSLPTPEVYHDTRIAQPVNIGTGYQLPFFASASDAVSADMQTQSVNISARSMLRYNNQMRQSSFAARVFYIPLDYWEF